MNKSPAFQWYPRDILSSARVQELSLEEEGAYRRLLDFCWLNGSIPADPERCARLIGKGACIRIADAVQKLFTPHPDDPTKLIHDRLELEREKQETNRNKKKAAADARWGDKSNKDNNEEKQTECKSNAPALQMECSSSATASSSSTAINNQKENSTEPLSDSPNPPVVGKPPNPAEIVFDHWKQVCNHPKAVLDAKRRRAIQDRLKQFSVEDCKRAIDGCRASPWHQGANDRGKVFDDIDLIFRDAKHVEDFIRVLEQTPATARGIVKTGSHQSVPKTAGNVAQMENWLNSRRASNG